MPNRIALDEMNPPTDRLSKIARAWAVASSRLDFSGPDRADSALLNRAIWYSTRRFRTPYPGDARVMMPHEVALLVEAGGGDGTRSASATTRAGGTRERREDGLLERVG